MRFLVLGPLEVTGEGGHPMPIPGSKERTILACLIARAGRVVPVDDLLEELWGEHPPKTADKTLASHVSRLRRVLDQDRAPGSPSGVILSRGDGYALEVAGDEVDAVRFERLTQEGRRLLDEARLNDARPVLDEALDLWRGQAYQGYRSTRFGTAEGERLEELRRTATEDWIDSRLSDGDVGTLVAELEAMVREEPFRERRWGQLMLALYRAGRQAEALQAFQRARRQLVDELGIEPGPDLERLQSAILAHDSELDRGLPRAERVRPTDVCPYKGLARFETSDAGFFFGREQLIAEAVARLVTGRFLALVGASGSGKSSLMRAGVLHALGSGAVPGSDRWGSTLIRPREHPLDGLSRAMADVSIQGRKVLAVDQFEEVFTACGDETERVAFLDALTDAALDPDGEVTIVLAMRADYYGRCAEHRALASLLATNQILVGPMSGEELGRAIELPAERTGLTVDEGLTDALVADCSGQAGALPLLSTTLLELWIRRRGRALGLDEYLRSGGIQGAVGRLAEDVYGRLDLDEQAAAKRILLRLAGSGESAEAVRRRAPLEEFDLDRDADASRAMDVLTEARLVTASEGTAEVAHEALLREWPRLRTWLEDDAEGRRLHRHVTDQARTWDEGGRDHADLYRGARLTVALEWADDHDADLNDLERAFLHSGRSASEGEAVRTRRANRVLRSLLAAVAVLLVLSLLVGNLALRQRDASRAAAEVADARQLAEVSRDQKDAIVALLLAREAVALDDSAQTRSALLAALQREPAAIAVMHPPGAVPGDPDQWLRLSPDERVIAAGGARSFVDLFDATSYRPLGRVDVGAPTAGGSFNPADGTLAVATDDRRIVRVDVNDPALLLESVTVSGGDVDSILFAPDHDLLLTAESTEAGELLVPRDPVTLEPSAAPVPSDAGSITAMAFSADGRWLVTTAPTDGSGHRGETELWSVPELERVRSFEASGNDVALSPDGRTAAIAAARTGPTRDDGLKGRLLLLDLRTGRQVISEEGRVPGRPGTPYGLTGVAFSADGRSVLSTGDDQRIVLWDAASATVRAAFEDPADLDGFAPVLSRDGSTGFTIDIDGNLVAWDLEGDRRFGQPFTAGSGAMAAGWPWFAISPDGRTLAIVQFSPTGTHGSVRLIDASTLEGIGVIPYHRYASGFPEGLAFSPDGETLAVASVGGYAQLFDVQTGSPKGPPLRAPGSDRFDLWVAAFSPDGSVLATAGADWSIENQPVGAVLLWHVATGEPLGQLPEQRNAVSSVSFSLDGTRIVAATGWGGGVGNLIIWDRDRAVVERTIRADDSGVVFADLSNDGTIIVTASGSGRCRLWEVSTGEPIGLAFNCPKRSLDLSPDGRTLVATGADGVTMWDVASGAILGRFPNPGPEDDLAASFTPDGRRLFVVSETGEAWVWSVDQASWPGRACRIAGRSLTPVEWQHYLPDRPYQATCGP